MLFIDTLSPESICDEGSVLCTVILKDKEMLKLEQQLVAYGRRGLYEPVKRLSQTEIG